MGKVPPHLPLLQPVSLSMSPSFIFFLFVFAFESELCIVSGSLEELEHFPHVFGLGNDV